jgi:hypothetical protein
MSPSKKIAIIFAIYTAAATLMLLSSPSISSLTRNNNALIKSVPLNIGSFTGTDLGDRAAWDFFLLKDKEGFKPLVRTYHGKDSKTEITLNALEDFAGYQRDIHDPRLCYESRGWTVLSFEDFAVDIGTMKLLTFANSISSVRRVEIYGYLVGGRIITSEIGLRIVHLRNRLLNLGGVAGDHIIFLGISTQLIPGGEKKHIKDLQFLMREVVKTLMEQHNKMNS